MTALVAAVSIAVLVTACGIGVDDEPRALDVTSTTSTSTTSLSPGPANALLYYVQDGALMPIDRELPNRSLRTVLESLLQGPTEFIKGLGTSIPSGTELLSVRQEGRNATIDLSSAFDNVVGVSRQQAIGQMVMTVTGVANAGTVEFEVSGKPITVSSPERGDSSAVGPCDFNRLLATDEDATEAHLPEPVADQLRFRREALNATC